jgi:hypothetical protein
MVLKTGLIAKRTFIFMIHTYERFSKPDIYSMIRLKIRCSQNRGPDVLLHQDQTNTNESGIRDCMGEQTTTTSRSGIGVIKRFYFFITAAKDLLVAIIIVITR